jgi:hypothetical protein
MTPPCSNQGGQPEHGTKPNFTVHRRWNRSDRLPSTMPPKSSSDAVASSRPSCSDWSPRRSGSWNRTLSKKDRKVGPGFLPQAAASDPIVFSEQTSLPVQPSADADHSLPVGAFAANAALSDNKVVFCHPGGWSNWLIVVCCLVRIVSFTDFQMSTGRARRFQTVPVN